MNMLDNNDENDVQPDADAIAKDLRQERRMLEQDAYAMMLATSVITPKV